MDPAKLTFVLYTGHFVHMHLTVFFKATLSIPVVLERGHPGLLVFLHLHLVI